MKLIKQAAIIGIYLAAGAALPAGVRAQEQIVAVVNNDVITGKDLNDFLNFMRMELSSQNPAMDVESKIEGMKKDLLQKLIEDKLILQEAKKSGAKVDESRIKGRLAQMRSQHGSDADFQRMLAKQGLVQADLEQRMREQFLTYRVIEDKVKKNVFVHPGEVTGFYYANIKEFSLPELREFEVVRFEDVQGARDFINLLRTGEEFSSAAQKVSAEVQSMTAYKGKEFKPEIDTKVFALAQGDHSDPIELRSQFYVFRVKNITPPREETLSEAQEKIYSYLMDNKMREAMTAWLETLKKNAYIKVFAE
jgi:peptidyl-prolyl cis-trans isomerase SurA